MDYDLDNDDEDFLVTYNAKAAAAVHKTGGPNSSMLPAVQPGGTARGPAAAAAAALTPPPSSSSSSLAPAPPSCSGAHSTAPLPDTKFERIMWRLDVACAEANERAAATGVRGDGGGRGGGDVVCAVAKERAAATCVWGVRGWTVERLQEGSGGGEGREHLLSAPEPNQPQQA